MTIERRHILVVMVAVLWWGGGGWGSIKHSQKRGADDWNVIKNFIQNTHHAIVFFLIVNFKFIPEM